MVGVCVHVAVLPGHGGMTACVSPKLQRLEGSIVAVLCILLLTVDAAGGHVAMLSPPSWSDAGGHTGMSEGWQWRLGNEPRVPVLVGSGSTSVLARVLWNALDLSFCSTVPVLQW